METIRDVLNRLRWDPSAGAEGVVVRLRVRRDGRETVDDLAFADVEQILPAGMECRGGVFIPYHRVVQVRGPGGVLWPPAEGGRRDG